MDINSKKGTKVVFANPGSGYEPEQELAKEHLKVGATYTVDRTEVGRFHTKVFLEEIPDVPFNSVMFD